MKFLMVLSSFDFFILLFQTVIQGNSFSFMNKLYLFTKEAKLPSVVFISEFSEIFLSVLSQTFEDGY